MNETADSNSDLETLEQLGQEFLDRQRTGETVSIDQYAEAHPQLAEKIRHLFPAMEAMERFKSCNATSSGGSVSLHLEAFEQLGDYRILREIGRGGMGVVYEAEQQSLQRRVAVKVLPRKTLSDSKRLSRFHREARTAARLHHTNIVQVFGVGEQEGMHYFVMQRIDGTPLDQWIEDQRTTASSGDDSCQSGQATMRSATTDDARLSAGETQRELAATSNGKHDDKPLPASPVLPTNPLRPSKSDYRVVADIGIQVADALEYAHAHGVLHRDIKPSNLLVDAEGRVWVTDFGLATFLETETLGDSEEVAGTLRFMAPEHLGGRQDARSDLYSLGLTLYELLTWKPAYKDSSRSALVAKIMKGALVPPRKLRPQIPRDLEAIVLKAVAVNPDHRYANAAEMSSDLRRFVEFRTVSARRSGPLSRLHRWSRRNPAAASLSAALLLTAGLSFALISAKWRDAVAESRRAENNLSLALESMDQILARFGSSWMAQPITATSDDIGGSETALEFQLAVSDFSADMLQDALRFYDKFAEQNPTNPRLNHDTAKVHRRVADIYQRLGQFAEAEKAYRRSLMFLHPDPDGDDTRVAMERASTLNQLGLSLLSTSRFEEAEAEFLRGLQVLAHQRYSNDPECQAEQARILTSLGRIQWLTSRREVAAVSQRRAVELLEQLVKQHADNAAYRVALAGAYRGYYELIAFSDRSHESEQLRLSGIEILENLRRDFPDVPDFKCELAEMLAAGVGSRHHGDPSARINDLQSAIQLTRDLTSKHPKIPRYRAVLARSLRELADTYGKSSEKSETLYSESATLHRSLVHDFSEVPAYHLFLAMALGGQGNHLQRVDKNAEARPIFEEAIASLQEYLKRRPLNNGFGVSMLAYLYKDLAETLANLGLTEQADEAMQHYRQYRSQRRRPRTPS